VSDDQDTRDPRYGQVDTAYARRLATSDSPVWMVNLMQYRERADYADGRETELTGQQADDEYTPFEALAMVGAEIVFAGEVHQQLLGDDPVWDRVAVVKYPSGRAFIEMQTLPEFQAKHVHKDAGMQQTFVIGTSPIDLPDLAAVSKPWSEVEHPPTDDDADVVVVHVLKFHDGDGGATPDDMAAYQSAAAQVAGRHGGRIDGWFASDGTIVGDGRTWDQVRFNAFPSLAAFMAVVTDPDRLAAQKNHREKAIADTYTMVVRPSLNRLQESLG
jgi:uncharacterized protein (DUF1330 family)